VSACQGQSARSCRPHAGANRKKAQIAVEEADPRYRNLRIDNALIDEHGDDVKLKKGAHVEVTVSAKND
jgi:hypothetical protein